MIGIRQPCFHQIQNQLRCIFCFQSLEKEKITLLLLQIRIIPRDNFMGIRNNAALLSLPENLIQSNHRNLSAVNQIFQDIASPYRWQLVTIAHHNQLATKPQCTQQAFK